jgi:D-arabinose 5-phosphate isomerase GutQ/beta-phosphoglucomutase-like phosphatase (HAD superfamily)
MNNILDYDLFIFDLDGTIIDSERLHYESWVYTMNEYRGSVDIPLFDYSEHHRYSHCLKKDSYKNFIYYKFGLKGEDEYDILYNKKQDHYYETIKSQPPSLIPGVENFLNFLIIHNKSFIIVSNTSKKIIEFLQESIPILKNAQNVYTKELFIHKKPNPECYLRISNEYLSSKKICFEDSLIGMNALYQVMDITPVFVYNRDYYYTSHIINNYKEIIISNDYDIDLLNISVSKYSDNRMLNDSSFITNILNNNINELQNNKESMKKIISQISIIISNLPKTSHIFLSGMGKSGYVCKKSVSTWQSLSIMCSYIDLPNLPHGDFGQFKDNDLIILISNSGNTEENVYILKYIKEHLKKKITTISIVANDKSLMEKYSDITFLLNNIKEADLINMTPSTSNIIFMALLDGIAINLKKSITKAEFQLCHPLGSLGKL